MESFLISCQVPHPSPRKWVGDIIAPTPSPLADFFSKRGNGSCKSTPPYTPLDLPTHHLIIWVGIQLTLTPPPFVNCHFPEDVSILLF